MTQDVTTQVESAVAISPAGFILDGEEQVLLCASLFYFRMPREVWAARLAQVRDSGYQVIDVTATDYAFIEVTPEGLLLREIAPGTTVEEVQRITEPKLKVAPGLREMKV